MVKLDRSWSNLPKKVLMGLKLNLTTFDCIGCMDTIAWASNNFPTGKLDADAKFHCVEAAAHLE